MRLATLLLLALTSIAACSRQPQTTATRSEVRIAAAASLRPILPTITEEFNKKNPSTTITVTYGASGALYAQITNGGPFDLFLSADTAYPQKLSDAGLTSGHVVQYGAGRLSIWTSKTSGLDPARGLEVLRDDHVKKIAIANPEFAPYGRAAEAALKASGIYDAIHSKIVMGESIEQTATFAHTGAAEVALISKTMTLTPPLNDEGLSSDVPENLYRPIKHGAVIIKTAQDSAAASRFLDFLTGPDAQPILTRLGLAAGH